MQARMKMAVVLGAILAPGAGAAQETPANWKWVTDAGETTPGDWQFTTMAPGWHVTMGPGAILYDPEHDVSGRFVLEAEIFIFPDPSEAGYGVFAGGTDLDATARTYVAFLARPDGSAGIFRYTSRGAEPIVDWTRHEAVAPAQADGSPKNVIRVVAERDTVTFRVNGQDVAAVPRAGLGLDGHVGLRIGPALNVHVSNFDITQRLAPVPAAR